MKDALGDRRLGLCAAGLGMLYAAMAVVGNELQTHGAFTTPAWKMWLWFGLISAVCTAVVWGVFALCKRQNERACGKPSRFGRVLGNPFLVFTLLVICWVPVWLAFWPGHFSADSLTQFSSYYNQEPYAHHPLVHTALLGFCMMLGIDLHPEGYATYGLAIYCGVQLVLLAACVAYGCWWMKKRGASTMGRLLVTLLFAFGPFYAPWAFCAQKDVLFAALAMVFCLQLCDLWQFGLKPWRCVAFGVVAVLMMLFRNNGVYALVLLIPFAVWWARKGQKWRMAALLVGCATVYLLVNNTMIALMQAEKGSRVEMLSIPLQQMGRTLRDHPEAIELDEDGVLEAVYGEADMADIYYPPIADPMKWAVDYDALDDELPALLKLWARMGLRYPLTYAEAALVQNLPYYKPYAPMLYNFDMTVHQIEWFPIEQTSYLPKLRDAYLAYDESLSFLGIPGMRLLSDTAVFVWLAMAGFAYALYRQKRGYMAAFGFLLAVWVTCLLGPVAIMRYLLSLFYAVPILLCTLLKREGKPC